MASAVVEKRRQISQTGGENQLPFRGDNNHRAGLSGDLLFIAVSHYESSMIFRYVIRRYR